MKFGYARVSKEQQSLDIQIQKLKEAGCEYVVIGHSERRKHLLENVLQCPFSPLS